MRRDPAQEGRWQAAAWSDLPNPSFDDFDDPVRARINQNSAAINHCVAVVSSAIFRGHVVIGDAISGKVGADPHVAWVGV